MTSVMEAGFVFWGVFVVFFLVIVSYVVWMLRTEAKEDRGQEP
jgi:cbb3-type cytochrome oxidase subunit 3